MLALINRYFSSLNVFKLMCVSAYRPNNISAVFANPRELPSFPHIPARNSIVPAYSRENSHCSCIIPRELPSFPRDPTGIDGTSRGDFAGQDTSDDLVRHHGSDRRFFLARFLRRLERTTSQTRAHEDL